jgi:uncharacterized protein
VYGEGAAAGRRLRELDEEECWRLLAGAEIGRLAWVSAGQPVVVPVNFRLAGRLIVVRVSPYSRQAREVEDAAVAFEVDDVVVDRQTGWSVLVQGRAVFDYRRQVGAVVEPWPEGQRPLQVVITPRSVTGRRVE